MIIVSLDFVLDFQKYHFSPVNICYNLKQIATEFLSAGMHSGQVFLKHT